MLLTGPILGICVAFVWTQGAAAQSTSERIVYGPCTQTDIVAESDALYAAAVGMMSTEKGIRDHLLERVPGRKNAALCSYQVSEAFCNSAFLEFAANALTSSMTAGGPGSVFFDALGAAEATEDPAGNALGLTMGVGGAILGGIMGSEDGFSGMAKGGLTGGALGLGAGTFWSSKMALDRCTDLQAQFTSLTKDLVSAGLGPQRLPGQLYGEISRLTARRPEDQRLLAEAMIEAMAVAAAKIESIR